MSKVKEYQVETIVDTLCTNMLSDKEQLRDISSIGLKTVIGELPPASSGKELAIQDILQFSSVTVLTDFAGLKNFFFFNWRFVWMGKINLQYSIIGITNRV